MRVWPRLSAGMVRLLLPDPHQAVTVTATCLVVTAMLVAAPTTVVEGPQEITDLRLGISNLMSSENEDVGAGTEPDLLMNSPPPEGGGF